MANIITGFRVLISIALLFCPVFSPVFYILYLTGGLSDMIDGTIARKMNTVTEFGARFDTAADFVFVVVSLSHCRALIPAYLRSGCRKILTMSSMETLMSNGMTASMGKRPTRIITARSGFL